MILVHGGIEFKMNSILTSIKKLLGIAEGYDVFDNDLIMHINSVFFILYQLGVGRDPSTPFTISGDADEWTDFIDANQVDLVKSYIYLKVRLLFDPPQNSSLLQAIKDQIAEFEWRGVVSTGK